MFMKNSKVSFPFSEEEIKEVVFFVDGSKCSGPNGFNFSFSNSLLMQNFQKAFFPTLLR